MTAAIRHDAASKVRGVHTPDAIEGDYRRWLLKRLERAHELLTDQLDKWLTGRRRDINARARQDSVRWDSVTGDVESLSRAIGAIRFTWGKQHNGDAAERRARQIGSQVSAFNKEAQKRVFREVAGLDPTFGDRGVEKSLKEFAKDNVDLITGLEGLDEQYFRQVEDKLVEALKEGRRHEDFAAIVQDRLGVAESRAKLIARDQVQKLNSRLTQKRQQDLGVTRYEWSTSGDERVRDSHEAKDGEVFKWSDPPSDTGHPGDDILCRCVAIPIVDDVLSAQGRAGQATNRSSAETKPRQSAPDIRSQRSSPQLGGPLASAASAEGEEAETPKETVSTGFTDATLEIEQTGEPPRPGSASLTYTSDSNGNRVAEYDPDLPEDERLFAAIDNWVHGSHRKPSMMMKEAVRREFNEDAAVLALRDYVFTDSALEAMQEDVQRLFRATQEHFAEQGIEKVTLYRGVALDPEEEDYSLGALEAWTSDEGAAKGLAEFRANKASESGKELDPVVLEEEFDVRNILVYHKGPNWHDGAFGNQSEYLVMDKR